VVSCFFGSLLSAFPTFGADKLFKTKTPGYVAQISYDWKNFVVFSLK